MIFDDFDKPIPTTYGNRLDSPDCGPIGLPPRRLVLAALVLLCLVPRVVMACKLGCVCPDGIIYFRLADCLGRGQFHEALSIMQFNLFPVILMLLHRAGLPWELAGAAWGVLISTCTVLPLYGWLRRQFDDRVALVAGFLYATHFGLIRWSPEAIREPTFWFLFTLSLYLLSRAITELRLRFYLGAGLAIALACLTRFEGFVLLVPLVLWSLRRGYAQAALRRRLALGGSLCVVVYPLLLVLVSVVWVRGFSPQQLLRSQPLELANTWARATWKAEGTAAADSGLLPAYPLASDPLPLSKMADRFTLGFFKGMTPLFLLLTLAGMIGWWRFWKRSDHQPLFYAWLAVLLAIWVHLWWSHEAGQRYFLTLVLMSGPFPALGLLWLSQRLAALARRRAAAEEEKGDSPHLPERPEGCSAQMGTVPFFGRRLPILAAAAVPLLVVAVNWTLILQLDYRFRTASVELGHWAERQFGPSPVLFGPDGVVQVVNYYARGRCEPFQESDPADAWVARAGQLRPDVVLLPSVRSASNDNAALLRRFEKLGFKEVDRSQFTGGCRKVLVLMRSDGPRGLASEPSPSRPLIR